VPSAVEVDGRLEMLTVTKAAGHALDLLNLAVESLTHGVGHRMLVVGQDIIDVPPNRLRRLPNGCQPTVRRPEVPPLPELPAGRVSPRRTSRRLRGLVNSHVQYSVQAVAHLLCSPVSS
jgi:hypothetical protein